MLAKGRNKHFTGQVLYLHMKESQKQKNCK